MTTYHSYAAALVGEHALRIGLEPDTRLVGEAVSWQYAAQVVESYDGDMEAVDRVLTTTTGDVLALAGEMSEHLRDASEVAVLSERVRAHLEALPRADGQRTKGHYADVLTWMRCLDARLALLPLVERYTALKRSRGRDGLRRPGGGRGPHRPRAPRGRRRRAQPVRRGAARRVPGHRRGAAGPADRAVRPRSSGDGGR